MGGVPNPRVGAGGREVDRLPGQGLRRGPVTGRKRRDGCGTEYLGHVGRVVGVHAQVAGASGQGRQVGDTEPSAEQAQPHPAQHDRQLESVSRRAVRLLGHQVRGGQQAVRAVVSGPRQGDVGGTQDGVHGVLDGHQSGAGQDVVGDRLGLVQRGLAPAHQHLGAPGAQVRGAHRRKVGEHGLAHQGVREPEAGHPRPGGIDDPGRLRRLQDRRALQPRQPGRLGEHRETEVPALDRSGPE